MSLNVLIVLVILCSARLALAERAITVDVARDVPFAAPELTAAVRVRLPADGTAVRLHVTPTAGGVLVAGPAGSREVALQGATGATAARLVALVATDLLADDLSVGAAPASTRTPRRKTEVSVLGAVGAWDGTAGGGSIDVAVPRGTWLGAIELGGGYVRGPVRLYTGTLRLGGGVRIGWLDVRAGLTLAPVITNAGAGDRTLLAGGGTSARLRVPLATSVRAVVAVGLDAFATRTHYAVDGMEVSATPWLAPWAAVGVEMTP